MKNILVFLLIYIVITLSTGYAQDQTNWPHWRGPDHNGIGHASNLPVSWDSNSNIIWKTKVPWISASTPIIWEDIIYIVSPSEDKDEDREPHNPGGSEILLMAISKSDGKILWQKQLDDKNELHRKSNDASPSPVTDGKHIFAVTGTGMVVAFDMDGKKIWQRNLQEEYGRFNQNWGYASSPLLHKQSLIIEVLHKETSAHGPSYILSINTQTGKNNWLHKRITDARDESPDAYTTPLLLKHGDKTEIVIAGGDCVTGHDFNTGNEIWRANGLNPRNRGNYRIVPSPITMDGIIYASSRKKPLLAIKAGGIGDISESHLVWKWDESGGPDVPTPLCDGTYFYMVEDKGKITCLDAKKGTLIWGPEKTTGGIVSASPILADGKIYIINENGVTAVVSAGNEFKLLATNELDGSHTLSSPAISDSKIYIRTGLYLYCIGNK